MADGTSPAASRIWDLLWAPAVVLAVVAAIVTLRVSAPYLPFIIIAGLVATVVEAGAWLAQARRDRRGESSSKTGMFTSVLDAWT